jgi:hypothetical protein
MWKSPGADSTFRGVLQNNGSYFVYPWHRQYFELNHDYYIMVLNLHRAIKIYFVHGTSSRNSTQIGCCIKSSVNYFRSG